MQSPTKSRYSVPRQEAGVAEWASKIKALQQQVDADEEAEHKKLEEEIAASRLARMRRSRGLHGGSSRASSVDLSSVKEILPPSTEADEAAASDEPRPSADRRTAQADALERLSGSRSDAQSRTYGNSSSSRPEPMSLAAFIGGRATGPRLNKHAPQADAHDPTQFEQRTHVSAPHPVFGRGGIAMPGMAGRHELSRGKTAVVSPSAASGGPKSAPMASPMVPSISEQTSHVSTYKSTSRDRTTSTPGPSIASTSVTTTTRQVVSRYTERLENRPSSPTKSVGRERTMSTPSAAPSFPRPASSQSRRVDSPLSRPKTPTGSTTAPLRTRTPVQENSWSPPPRSVITPTPSLAKPRAPEPKPVQPLIPSQNPSPAFLKPLSQKDPTPSISRLQGRGFVQNMVQASRKLEGPASSSHVPERLATGRKSSVLDRWPGAKVSSPSPPPQLNLPKPMRMQKSFTVEPKQEPPEPVPTKPLRMRKSFTAEPQPERVEEPEPRRALRSKKSVTFSDVSSNSPAPVRVHVTGREENGLGSKTTLVVIKNTTGGEYPEVDELGVQRDAGSRPHSRSELPPASGAPLIHPTRDRAKRPKKSTTKTEPRGQVAKDPEAKPKPVEEKVIVAPEEHTSTESATTGGKTSKVTDRWEHAVIGVKAPEPRQLPTAPTVPTSKGMVGRRALPGLAVLPTTEGPSKESSTIAFPQVAPQSPVSTPPASSHNAHAGLPQRRPSTSKQHKRIPSTGNRATVMDVAQALTEQEGIAEVTEESSVPQKKDKQVPVISSPISESPVALTAPPMERRRSSHDRFSAVTLPALVEEVTPTPTPAGTLKLGGSSPLLAEKPEIVQEEPAVVEPESDKFVHLDFKDQPSPAYDVSQLIPAKDNTNSKESAASVTTISVEVLSIRGDMSTTLNTDVNIFHDDEVLAVVHRAKSKSSGLVDTTVWSWEGKNSALGDREEQKLRDLGKRYGTSVIPAQQYYEAPELVRVLGGKVITRQGPRNLWSVENTAMHRVRCLQDVLYIEEIDFDVKNLCSGYSYCLTVLGNVYVWHGVGSLDSERAAAMDYAGGLGEEVTKLSQGVNDSDETFWMVLGDEEYAKADYWKWRRSSACVDPRIWRIVASSASIEPVRSFIQGPSVKSSVFVVDCVWEIFVIVGLKARANRGDIRFGIEVANGLASAVADNLPYKPTVHVLVIPTQLPVDLKAHFRDINEAFLNGNDIPDHMNMLTTSEALEQLATRTWQKIALKDDTMLPLGLDPMTIPQP